ncbi:MAG: sialidase family protein [Planctomycetota bacterium]
MSDLPLLPLVASVGIVLGCVSPLAAEAEGEDVFFRATISPVTNEYHGQWNVALAELPDGQVLAIWEAGHTETKTPNVILSSTSSNGGRSWGEAQVFYQREGVRCTPSGFFKLDAELHCVHTELPLAGHRGQCIVVDRVSTDGGARWGERREIRAIEYGAAMQPAVLRDRRIALPVYYSTGKPNGSSGAVSRGLISADGAQTWTETAVIPCDIAPGPMEPALAECNDGGWLCLVRTRGTAKLYAARSADHGQSWTPAAPLPLESPESIARLLRLHDDSLLVVWNGVASKRQGPRTPLTAVRSYDGGRTWPERRDLVHDPAGGLYSNHGVVQLRDGTVLVAYQDFHRDPDRSPQRSGVDSVGLVGFNLEWLSGRKQTQ